MPSVALHAFVPSVNKSGDVAVASAISELLFVELSNSNEIYLLDRTLILDAFDEKHLVLGAGSQSVSTLSLDKTPAAQYVVTGLYLNAYKNKRLSVRFIKADTGRILGHVIFPFEKATLNNAVAKANQFIHLQINSLKKISNPKGRSVGIGLFRDVGRGNASLGLGDDLGEKLINQYSKNIDVMARTEMYPLYLESYIEQFQFRSKNYNERPDVPMYIYGNYEVINEIIYLRLHLDLLGQKRLTKAFQASSRIKLYELVKNYLDKYILPYENKASKDDRDKAENIYQSILVKNEYKRSLAGRYKNESWYYIGLVWDDNKAIHANETILSLKKILKLDSGHDQARLLLAHSLLKRDSLHQKEARQHLKWLYFHSDNAALVKKAEGMFHTKILASTFKGIVQDTNKLYTQLIEDTLLTKSGSRNYTYGQALKNKKVILGDYSKNQIAEILSELQLSYYYIQKKSEEKIKRTYRNIESDLHFYYGQKISGLKIERKNSLVFISKIDVPYSGVRKNKELSHAIDELTSAIYLDSDFLIAKLFLAHTLKAFGGHYLPHVNLLFQDVLSSTQNDELKFLAADALDRIEETRFTEIFDLDLKHSGYLAKKYEGRYKKQSDKSDGRPFTVANKSIENSYLKNLEANCGALLFQSTRKHSVLHWMEFGNECLNLFEEMTSDAIEDEASYTLREKILENYRAKHPGLVPHLLMTNNFDNPKFIKQQLKVLSEIEQGLVQPLSEDELIYQLKKIMPDWGKKGEGVGLAISYFEAITSLEKSSYHDKLDLASLYTITGDTRGKKEVLKAATIQSFDVSGTPDTLFDGHYEFQKSDGNGNMIYSCKSNPDYLLQYTYSKNKTQFGHWSLRTKGKSFYTTNASYGPLPSGKRLWHNSGNYRVRQDIQVTVPIKQTVGLNLPSGPDDEIISINAKHVSIKPFIDQASGKIYGIKAQGVAVFDNNIIIGTRSLKNSSVSLYDSNGVRTQQASLKDSKGNDYRRKHQWFGASVDLHKDHLIVGAPRENGPVAINEESFTGSYIAQRISAKKIMSMLFDKGYVDVFGFITPKLTHNSVNIQKDFSQLDNIEVSSIWKVLQKNVSVENTGSAHIFRKINGQWQREGLLLASDAHKQNMFGNRVAIYDDTALICASGKNPMLYSKETRLSDVSGAYLFVKSKEGWKQKEKITQGRCLAVAVTKNWLFVTMESMIGETHTVIVFKNVKNELQKWQELSVSDSTRNRQNWYYHSVIGVDESTGTLAIGDKWDEVSKGANRKAGSVQVFQLTDSKWHKTQNLDLSGPATASAEFGSAIGISNDYLAIGASGKREKQDDRGGIGKVYLYKKEKNHWYLKEILSPEDGRKYDKFGGAISIDGKDLVIASTRDDGKNKVYLYKISE